VFPLPSLPHGHAPVLAVPLPRPATCSPRSPHPHRPAVLDCSPRSRIVCAAQPSARRAGRRRCRKLLAQPAVERVRHAAAASRPFFRARLPANEAAEKRKVKAKGQGHIRHFSVCLLKSDKIMA